MEPDRMRFAGLLAGLSLAILVIPHAGATAPLFVCKTPSGHTLTSDRPPPECRDTPIRELNPDGSVRNVIEPPLTPEQRQARDAEERRRHEREAQAQEQLRKDRALLETYASEDEIEAARDRTLAVRQTLIDRAGQTLTEYKTDRKHLDEEAEFYLRRPMPDKLKRAIENNNDLQRQQLRSIEDIRSEMRRINEQYDAELRRFRELVMRGSIAVQHKTEP